MLTKSPVYTNVPAQKADKNCKLINGIRVYYEMKGTGQPLIFIHDFTLDNRMWDDQFYFFSKWYRCIRYDIRGYGQSSLPGSQSYTFQDDLKSLLFSLDISEPVILVGHSMGGRVASNFALQYPRFTKALVLADAQIEGYDFKEFKLDIIFNSAKQKSIEYAKRKWFGHNIFAQAKKNKLVSECLWQIIQSYSGWHFVSPNYPEPTNPCAWEQLENIEAPALIMYGDLDLPDFREMSEAAAARIPGAKKRILSNTGHMSNMENPAAFNNELQQFLKNLVVA